MRSYIKKKDIEVDDIDEMTSYDSLEFANQNTRVIEINTQKSRKSKNYFRYFSYHMNETLGLYFKEGLEESSLKSHTLDRLWRVELHD